MGHIATHVTAGLGALLATAASTVSGTTCTAVVNGITVTVNVPQGLTVAINDVLLVQRVGAQWYVVDKYYGSAPVPVEVNDDPPDPKPTTVTGTLIVSPVETRSYRNGEWRMDTTDVLQGQYGAWGNNTGAVFYGQKPRSLAGATVTDAKIRVQRVRSGLYAPQATTMRLMTESTRPSGAPTLTSTTAGPSLAVQTVDNAFDVSNSWVQEMVDGTAGGLAFFDSDGSPYVRFSGRGSWSPAFTLTISWSRTT